MHAVHQKSFTDMFQGLAYKLGANVAIRKPLLNDFGRARFFIGFKVALLKIGYVFVQGLGI